MAEATQSTCGHCGQAMPAGDGQGDPAEVTAERFAGMNVGQRNELLQTNPDLYRRLTGRARGEQLPEVTQP